jgi:hypothetical protein
LIERADPNYTIVRSKEEWARFGYKLKKNAKGIPILYPVSGGKKVMPGEVLKFIEEKRKEGLSDEIILSQVKENFKNVFRETHVFRVGFVYDKRDVVPDKKKKQLDEWNKSLSSKQLYENAKSFAKLYYKVVEGGVPDARGVSKRGEIRVLKVPGENKNAVNTILHEIAHQMLNHLETKQPKEVKEMEAELVAYLVAKHYGVDLKDRAQKYLASYYKNGGKEHFGEENIDRVLKTAHQIIQGIDEVRVQKGEVKARTS